jgi:adenylylsulfate kinase
VKGDSVHLETNSRSIYKAVSWRIWGTVATSSLVFLFTGRYALSLAVGALEFVSKIGLFFVHERIWNRIRFGRREIEPAVVWLTGLSGAGKSTIAERVCDQLRRQGLKVEHLDGDSIRDIFPATGFTKSERDAHIRRIAYLASRLERHGVFVVASFVSPYAESREFARGLCRNFIEVHVATPLEECERRDVKGLYAKARRGELAHFTGIDDPYEPPNRPELRLDTRALSPDAASRVVVGRLKRRVNRSRDGSSRAAGEPEYSYSA